MQTVSHSCRAALYPADPSGKNMRLHLDAGSLWFCVTNTLLIYSSLENTYLCKAHKTHSSTLLHHFSTQLPSHTSFGCNKTADQSHWLLTGTDTETCCCWKAAWEMFITHKACRFGQERNNVLIKWRPGAAVGEIHTRPHTHPHVLQESL